MPPRTPRSGWPPLPPRAPATTQAAAHGTLNLRVQPATAEVSVDGARWTSSDGEHFVLELPAGSRHIEVFKSGYLKFSSERQLGDGGTTPLNVSLTPERL